MNNQFNFNRFLLLIKRQWNENKKLFLMGMAVLLGLGIIFYGTTTSWRMANLNYDIQMVTVIVGLFFAGAIFTNFIFKDFSEKNTTGNFLMIPASLLEKLLAGTFYSLIVYPIVLLIIFSIIDYSFVNYLNINHIQILAEHKEAIVNWQENIPFLKQFIKRPNTDKGIIIGIWLVSQIFTILGSIAFGRWSIIKTFALGFCTFFGYIFIFLFFHKLLIGDLFEKMAGNDVVGLMDQTKPITDLFSKILLISILLILPTILLISSYFKLKEKQV